MKAKRYIVPALLLLAFVTAPMATEGAIRTSAMSMGVRVLPVLKKTVNYKKAVITIGREDIKRGYIDVKDAAVVKVVTNSRTGYLIFIEERYRRFPDIWVYDGPRVSILNGSSGIIHRKPAGVSAPDVRRLGFRLFLRSDMQPGTYTWPIYVNVSM